MFKFIFVSCIVLTFKFENKLQSPQVCLRVDDGKSGGDGEGDTAITARTFQTFVCLYMIVLLIGISCKEGAGFPAYQGIFRFHSIEWFCLWNDCVHVNKGYRAHHVFSVLSSWDESTNFYHGQNMEKRVGYKSISIYSSQWCCFTSSHAVPTG